MRPVLFISVISRTAMLFRRKNKLSLSDKRWLTQKNVYLFGMMCTDELLIGTCIKKWGQYWFHVDFRGWKCLLCNSCQHSWHFKLFQCMLVNLCLLVTRWRRRSLLWCLMGWEQRLSGTARSNALLVSKLSKLCWMYCDWLMTLKGFHNIFNLRNPTH